jgi:phosphoenolpyruvate carboxylase
MADYATLVLDEALRSNFMSLITEEFERTKEQLAALFDGGMETRRPRMAKTLAIRDEPLAVLHSQQVALLRDWRKAQSQENNEQAEQILPKLLLSINAIASGLRTTG